MNPLDLLNKLNAVGVVVSANGDKLAYDSPRGAITPDLLEEVKAHKAEMLAMLAKRAELDQRIADQLARLVPCRMADGQWGRVHPQYRAELDRLGLL
jgi:hypothetical protein